MYKAHDVCIVGRGSVFAGTWNATEFQQSVVEGRCFIKDLRETTRASFPWDVRHVFNEDPKAEDQSYTPYGAYIDRAQLKEITEKRGRHWAELTTAEAVCIEALEEALAPVCHLPEVRQAELILGVSTVDTEGTFYLTDQLMQEIRSELKAETSGSADAISLLGAIENAFLDWKTRKPFSSYFVSASLGDRIKRTFGLEGPASLIDAACASSLAAFHVAIKRLQNRESDVIISGGLDVSVSPGCLVFFSRLGAMSPRVNAPFDQSAGGLTQGEGAGLFVLMRLEDAVEKKLKIYGVLKACEGSSDGKGSSIVEPTAGGQLLAYQRTYAEAGVKDVDAIEAHGTGTQIGDRTEIASLSQQFPKRRIPVSSVKANVGHTIAAAGAAALLKNIAVLESKRVPPSPYFEKFPRDFKTQLFVSPKPYALPATGEPLTLAQSSFGFGGSNFHMVVQEYVPSLPLESEEPKKSAGVVVCGERRFTFEELGALAKTSAFRLPPNVVPRIEPAQLYSVQAAEQTFKELGIFPQALDGERVAVISATMSPLPNYWPAGKRVIFSAVRRLALREAKTKEARDAMERVFAKLEMNLQKISEDTLVGFLNNIVAGRVCNAFDFKGVSFNLDADTASRAAAIRTARTLLAGSHGLVVIISTDDVVNDREQRLERSGLACTLVASATYALEYDLPIASIVNGVAYRASRA